MARYLSVSIPLRTINRSASQSVSVIQITSVRIVWLIARPRSRCQTDSDKKLRMHRARFYFCRLAILNPPARLLDRQRGRVAPLSKAA
jgi:hypothetical protein